MAIDPYRKSRRIRNVILEAKGLLRMLQGTMLLEGRPIAPKRSKELRRFMARRLWSTRHTNKWQTPDPPSYDESAKVAQNQSDKLT